MKNQTRTSATTKMLTGVAAFSALAYGVSLVTNIKVGFLSFDAKDAVITIASFIYGPLSALAMSFVTAFLEFISFGSTGPYGALMDFVSTFSFTFTASLIYKYRRNLYGALMALGAASAVYVAVMMVANLIITPLYMGVERSVVEGKLLTAFLPFNLLKAGLNSALVLVLYKPLVTALRKANLAPSKVQSTGTGNKTGVWILGLILLATCILLLLVFQGKI